MEMPAVAIHACMTCRRGRRKCDRMVPNCSRCVRLELACSYNRPDLDNKKRKPKATSVSMRNTTPPLRHDILSSIVIDPVSRLYEFLDAHQHRRPDFDRAISTEVLEIIGNCEGGMESITENYFSSVHTWLPIVSKTMFQERLTKFLALELPSAEMACLLLCIYLVTRPHMKCKAGNSESVPVLFSKTKCIHSLVQSSGPVSIELVQAALLITVYEIGNGLLATAYVSIGSCARMFSAMSLEIKGKDNAGNSQNSWIKVEEERRTRWGIIILDRFLNTSLGRELDSFATLSLSDDKYLPTQDNIWDTANENDSPPPPLPISISSNVKVGPFARQAQVAYLLGRVLQHVHEPTPNNEFNKEEGDQLERTLHSLNKILTMEIAEPGADLCGAIGMCNSALLTLIIAEVDFDEYPCKKGSSIRMAVKYVMEHANYMKAHESSANPRVLTLLVPYSIYQAAILHIRILGFLKADPRCHYWAGNLYILKSLLVGFGQTWKISEEYLKIVEATEATVLFGGSS